MKTTTTFLGGVALLAIAAAAGAQSVHRVLDINKQPAGGNVDRAADFAPLVAVLTTPPTLYFSAFSHATGRELWRTRGTAATTRMLADHVPGPVGSDPVAAVALPNGTVIVAMRHDAFGVELHRVAGDKIVPIANARPGSEGFFWSAPTVLGSRALWFSQEEATDKGVGRWRLKLWSTDGSTMSLVKDLGVAARQAIEAVPLGNRIVFNADDGKRGSELWVSDGTSVGTKVIQDVVAGKEGSAPTDLAVLGSAVYAALEFPGKGRELARTDGTTVTLVKDIRSGSGGSAPSELTAAGAHLVFVANDGTTGNELWRSDGTAAGTTIIKDLLRGATGSDPRELTRVGGDVYVSAIFPAKGRELGKTDGKDVVLVDDTNPGARSGNPTDLVSLNGSNPASRGGNMGFQADNGTDGRQVYATDGTKTEQVTNTREAIPGEMVDLGPHLIVDYSRADGDIFRAALSPSSLTPLANANGPAQRTGGADPGQFLRYREFTYFTATNGKDGAELYQTDGTEQGTKMVTDVNRAASSRISGIVPLPHGLFMSAFFPGTGEEPFLFEKGTGNLRLIKDIVAGPTSSNPTFVTGPFKVTAYQQPVAVFQSGPFPTAPWVSDGTPGGTVRLQNAKGEPFAPSHFAALKGEIFFQGRTLAHGSELWASDGTPNGTRLVRDIAIGTRSSRPRSFVRMGEHLYFAAAGFEGEELWRTDGSKTGTELVKDIRLGAGSSFPRELTVLQPGDFGTPMLVFAARTSAKGDEIWRSDGTKAGTLLHYDANPGRASTSPRNLTLAGTLAYFSGTNPEGETTLHVVDRFSVYDLGARNPSHICASGTRAFFVADDGTGDRELWMSDGEIAQRIGDINPGPESSNIRGVHCAGGVVWISADDGVTGQEVHRVGEPGAASEQFGAPCGPDQPTLDAAPAVLGAATKIFGESPKDHLVFVTLGLSPRRVIPIGDGCLLQIDPTVLLFTHAFSSGKGGSWEKELSIPNDGQLRGVEMAIQAVQFPAFTFRPIQGSNGVRLRTGR